MDELIISSIFLNTDLLPVMWDYSNLPLNYKGIICVPFMLLWMVLSFVGILVADAINYYVFDEEPAPYYKLFGHTIIQFKSKHIYGNDNDQLYCSINGIYLTDDEWRKSDEREKES